MEIKAKACGCRNYNPNFSETMGRGGQVPVVPVAYLQECHCVTFYFRYFSAFFFPLFHLFIIIGVWKQSFSV